VLIVDNFCAELNIRCHNFISTYGDHIDDVTVLFPPVDGTGLHLAADSISLHDESVAVLVGILSKGDRAIVCQPLM